MEITGYVRRTELESMDKGFHHHFDGTRSPKQGTMSLTIWELKDDVYVDDSNYIKVKATILTQTE